MSRGEGRYNRHHLVIPQWWPSGAVRLCGVGVLLQRLAGLLGRHGLQSLSLDVPGLVVEEDAAEDQGGAGGAEDGDLVAEHDDAEPNGQGVFDGAGDAAGRGRVGGGDHAVILR